MESKFCGVGVITEVAVEEEQRLAPPLLIMAMRSASGVTPKLARADMGFEEQAEEAQSAADSSVIPCARVATLSLTCGAAALSLLSLLG